MSRRRRHADFTDFTDSLNSFRCTKVCDIKSDTSCSLHSMSPDSLDKTATKASQEPRGVLHDNNHSVILAGSSIKNHHISSLSNASASLVTSEKSTPDSFQSELLQAQAQCVVSSTHLDTKLDEQNNNPQCSMTDKQSTNEVYETITKDLESDSSKEEAIHSRNIATESSKRDINYNICHKFDTGNTNNKEKPDLQDESQSASDQEKFESILYSLDNQYSEMKKLSELREIIRRLSDKYTDSSINFTERLLTIIEESLINIEENSFGPSALDLRKLATEFRQMCKFVEHNEPLDANIRKNEKSLPVTPLSGAAVTKTRFFQRITKKNYHGSVENLTNLSTNSSSLESFENLEAQCKRLFSEDQEYSHPLRKSISIPSLLNMSQIQNICEKQEASLNYNTADEDKTIVNSPKLSRKYLFQSPRVHKLKFTYAKSQLRTPGLKKNVRCGKVYSKTKSIKLNKDSESNKPNTKSIYDPDELEKTFLQDIAEKRKSCLDTARLSTEITGDLATAELQKSLGISFMSSTDSDSNSISHDEIQFLKTLASCKNYEIYLEKKKPFFNLLCKPNALSRPDSAFEANRDVDLKCKENRKEISSGKKIAGVRSNISTTKPYNRNESPLIGKKDENNKGNTDNAKPTLFYTPGKFSQRVNYKKNKLYFSSPGEKSRNTLKSPYTKELYRSKNNNVVSPVGMYIRSSDSQLTKNIRAETDVLLSSAKKNVKKSPNSNLQQPTTSGTSKPRRNVETNRPYKHEIKETKPTKSKIEKLLENAENRIINRRKGRIELLP